LGRKRGQARLSRQGRQVTIRDNLHQIGSDPAAAEVFYDQGGTAGDFTEDYDTRVTEFAYDAQGGAIGPGGPGRVTARGHPAQTRRTRRRLGRSPSTTEHVVRFTR